MALQRSRRKLHRIVDISGLKRIGERGAEGVGVYVSAHDLLETAAATVEIGFAYSVAKSDEQQELAGFQVDVHRDVGRRPAEALGRGAQCGGCLAVMSADAALQCGDLFA